MLVKSVVVLCVLNTVVILKFSGPSSGTVTGLWINNRRFPNLTKNDLLMEAARRGSKLQWSHSSLPPSMLTKYNFVESSDDMSASVAKPFENDVDTVNDAASVAHVKSIILEPLRSKSVVSEQPLPMSRESFLKNLDFFRRNLFFNCSLLSATPTRQPPVQRHRMRATTSMPSIIRTMRPPRRPAMVTTTARPIQKVYVDPPAVEQVEETFATVYNFLETALTDRVRVPTKKAVDFNSVWTRLRPPPRRNTLAAIRRRGGKLPSTFVQDISASENGSATVTVTEAAMPRDASTSADEEKQILTTNIQVTSQYGEAMSATPSSMAVGHSGGKKKNKKPASVAPDDDDSYESEYNYDFFGYNEPEADYNDDDASDDEDKDNDNKDDDDDDDDEDNYEDNYEEDVEEDDDDTADKSSAEEDNDQWQRTNRRKKHTKKASSTEDTQEEADVPFGFVGNFFASVGKFIASMTGYDYYGNDYKSTADDELENSRGTTPRADNRKTKTPLTENDFYNQNDIDDVNIGPSPWFVPLIVDNSATTPLPKDTSPKPATAQPSWFQSWFLNNNDEPPKATEVPSSSASDDSPFNWFPNWFGDDEPSTVTPNLDKQSVTTEKTTPLSLPQPIQVPWLPILASSALAQPTKRPTRKTALPTVAPAPHKVSYDGYQLWRIVIENDEQFETLDDYRQSADGAQLQWWKQPPLRGPTDFAVPPTMLETVQEFLNDELITYEVIIWDLQKAIEYEKPSVLGKRQLEKLVRTNGHPMTWFRYHQYSDIVDFMEFLKRQYPDNVELIHIGRSFEGRMLTVVKISTTLGSAEMPTNPRLRRKILTKRAVFIEAGAHAREWIAPAVATWILDTLIRVIDLNDTDTEILRSFDWYIMPVLNPDGYEYSYDYDRMWQKSRSMHRDEPNGVITLALNWLLQSQSKDPSQNAAACVGVDLNRNWELDEEELATTACNDFYRGPRMFSEPETRALSKFINANRQSISVFFSLHGYGQMISFPTGGSVKDGHNHDELIDMALVGASSIRDIGQRYQVDSLGVLQPNGVGTSNQWALAEAKIRYAFQIELRDRGTHGFLLPASDIEPTAREALTIIKAMVDYV